MKTKEAVTAVVSDKYCGDGGERELTVRKTSLFYPGDGYAAYDHHTGELVFRVDTYARGPSLTENLVLMDPDGAPILTVRRKWPSLHQRWEGFLGDKKEGQQPIFSVKRSSIFGGDRNALDVDTHGAAHGDREYRIEGSFARRSCRVVACCDRETDDEKEAVVAEIKRKVDACSQVVLPRDVFSLLVKPRFDSAFAMGLVIVLDQITGDEEDVGVASVLPFDDGDRP